MIYLEESLNLVPASPATIDEFVAFATEKLVPVRERLGARLAAAWFTNADRYAEVIQVWEFDDLAALGAFCAAAKDDKASVECEEEIEKLAPERHTYLMEALGPIPPRALQDAADASRDEPVGTYSMAILDVAPGKMPQFIAGLEASSGNLPIIASWRNISGRQNRVVDVWTGAVGQEAYGPANDGMKAFFQGLRQFAPQERIKIVRPLPHSPLQ